MIRHARLGMTLTVVSLTIAMVGFAIGSLLVFVIRLTALPPSGFQTATITAIAVATITAATDVENRTAVVGTTESLPKDNIVSLDATPHRIAGWTSGPPS